VIEAIEATSSQAWQLKVATTCGGFKKTKLTVFF